MAILAECPICHKKQATKNKLCSCGEELDKAKQSKRVKYWISYRLPGGKQKREPVKGKDVKPYSIEDAQAMLSKRVVQKKENKIFDIKPDAEMTFKELSEWYLGLEKVKLKAYYPTLKINLNSFNAEFGHYIVGQIKPVYLENYQAKRKTAGYSDSYVDQEIGAARGMINKAFDNDLVSGDTLRSFKKVKKLLKRNSNARDRILTLEEFNLLMGHLPRHTKEILATGFFTGMRRGEILNLTWDKVDLKNRVIQLEKIDTKDNEPRKIPICDELYTILKSIPVGIHDNHVILFKGRPIKDLRTALKRACNDAKIPYGRKVKNGFTLHDLRHTFNTYMRKAAVPESVIMEITGHSTREMFDRYNTIDDEDTRQAVDQLQSYFKGVDQTVDQKSIAEK
jgi:integrase